jgi:hypothetical protein
MLETIPVSVTYEHIRDDHWRIGVKIHHAIYDGVSLPSLLADLEHNLTNPASCLGTDEPAAFTTFAAKSYADANREQTKIFWAKYLALCSAQAYTRANENADVHSRRFARYRPHFFSDAQSLLDTARIHGVTAPALFLAIYARAWSQIAEQSQEHHGSQSNVVVGVYIANRNDDTAITRDYPTVNLLPVVVNTSVSLFESAVKVQSDLIEISSTPNVAANLWQIEQWTGVKVETFVNWLQLPDGINEEAQDSPADRFRVKSAMDQVVEKKAEDFIMPAGVEVNKLREAYLVSNDFL